MNTAVTLEVIAAHQADLYRDAASIRTRRTGHPRRPRNG
jgi:hypothetical protein